MKLKRQLEPEQAAAAYTIDRHISVTAGPGSGKTTVLVERYLHILLENNPWIPLYQVNNLFGHTKSIQIKPAPNFRLDFRKEYLTFSG